LLLWVYKMIKIHYWISILSLITTNVQVEQSRLYDEEIKEILATGLDQVLGAHGIYLKAKLYRVWEPFAGAGRQGIQCQMHVSE